MSAAATDGIQKFYHERREAAGGLSRVAKMEYRNAPISWVAMKGQYQVRTLSDHAVP
jgi:hypothetical protein